MSNKLLKYIIYAGIFSVPFIHFIVDPSLFFPFITGKAFVFRILVLIMLASFTMLAIRDESYRPRFSWILGTILTFLIFMGVANVFAENPFKAFWSNYERMEGYVTVLYLTSYFLVVGSVLKTQEMWNKLIAASLACSFIMSIYSLFQIAGKITINQGGVRVDGTLGNAAYLGIYMVFHIFFAAILFFRSRYTWQKIILSVISIFNLVILYFTATRGSILGLIGGAFVSLIFLAAKSERGEMLRKVAFGGVFGIIIFIGLFIAFKDNAYIKNNSVLGRFASLSFSEIKTQGRYYVWPMAIKGFIERPVFGWGQEGFNFVFNKYYDPRMYSQEPWFDRAHNTFLDWLIAGGLFGFISYLSIICATIFYIFRAKEEFLKKEDKAIIFGLLAAYLFNNLFVFDQISSYILFFTLLAYVHSHTTYTDISIWKKFSEKIKNLFNKETLHPIFDSSVIILAVAVLYFSVFSPWKTNKDLIAVLRLNNQNEVGTVDQYMKPLKKYGSGFSESLEHVSQTAMGLTSNSNASNELKENLFREIDLSFEKQLKKNPNDARYHLFYGLFLSRFGWYGRATQELEKASKLSPKKQSIYFELANNLIMDNKKTEALEKAKIAYELEPKYDEAKMVYALVASLSGDYVLANKLFSEIDSSKLIFDDRYLNVLVSFGESNKAIEIAKKRIEFDPSNLQHRITLAAVYLNLNRREESISTIEEIIKINPEFKEQGEYYIKEIRSGRNP